MQARYPPAASSFVGGRGGGGSTASGAVGCLSHVRLTAGAKLSRYMRRLVHVSHMDFELAAWQMVYLLARPQQVYRNFMYRKRTKDQWARDDPAFLVLLSAALLVSSMIFTFVLGLSTVQFVKFFLWVVFIDCILVGVCVATALWAVCNACLRSTGGGNSRATDAQNDVEWAYCFDVHLNAFFPMLMLLHVLMPVLYIPLIQHDGFIASFIGNTIWAVAVGYYVYITFLGYAAMKHLRNTHIFLYPFTFLFIFYIATVTMQWNLSKTCVTFYEFRVMS